MIDLKKVYYLKPLNKSKPFFVYWLLGNFCTYSCSYCPSRFNNGSVPYIPLDVIHRTLDGLPKSNIMFGGGEPSYHPDFESIIAHTSREHKYSILSNGSRPIQFWERVAPKLFTVVLTYHIEFARHGRFMDLAKLVYLEHKKQGHVNLTMLPSRWSECVAAFDALTDAGIKVLPKPLLEDFGVNAEQLISDYTPDQLSWIQDRNVEQANNIGLYDIDNNLISVTNPNILLSAKQTDFHGWECSVGKSFMLISFTGDVYNSQCGQRKSLGNIYGSWQQDTSDMLCTQHYCWCHTDIIAEKKRANYAA